MQAQSKTSMLRCAVTPTRASMQVFSRKGQQSAVLIQLFSSNGTMLPMLTWGPLTSDLTATRRSGGHVISAPMVTCTPGKQLSITGPQAQVVLSALAAKCASTTAWPPRLPRWQPSGTMKQMIAHLMMFLHKATSQLVGAVTPLATSGVQHPITGSVRKKLAAQGVLKLQEESCESSTQPLQRFKTLTTKLSWQNGTTNALHGKGIFPTTSLCGAASQSSSSAPNVQQGWSTAGVQSRCIEPATTSQTVHFVLGGLLADAIPCKNCTLI